MAAVERVRGARAVVGVELDVRERQRVRVGKRPSSELDAPRRSPFELHVLTPVSKQSGHLNKDTRVRLQSLLITITIMLPHASRSRPLCNDMRLCGRRQFCHHLTFILLSLLRVHILSLDGYYYVVFLFEFCHSLRLSLSLQFAYELHRSVQSLKNNVMHVDSRNE